MAKTAGEWFGDLPMSLAVKALSNSCGRTNEKYGSLSAAIEQNFTWKETPEGSDFWRAVYDKAKEAEENKVK